MKKLYLIAPTAALLIFVGFYWGFCRAQSVRETQRVEALQAEQKVKAAAEIEARRQAVVEAVRLQAERQKEREARDALERAQVATRQEALVVRDSALLEHQTLSRQLDDLRQELAAENATLAQLSVQRSTQLAEQAFLKTICVQAEANVQAIAAVIAKLPPAEAAVTVGLPDPSRK